MKPRIAMLICLPVLFTFAPVVKLTTAAEKWTDPAIRTPDGLVLWLDASRQKAAWQAHGKPELTNGSPIDVVYDGSGNGLHPVQRVAGMQPRFVEAGDFGLLRFSGKETLGLTGAKQSLDDFTLFLVAAPRSNAGDFQAFVAVNETGKNDYTTGFTVDQHFGATKHFSQVNVEGKGFGGAVNLMKEPSPFGPFRLIEVHCKPGKDGVKLYIDGVLHGQRSREAGKLKMDQIALGARCYSNNAEPPSLRGFLDGDIAEVMLFSRILKDDERGAIVAHLQKKIALLNPIVAKERQGHLLKPVANAPPVQFLVPGFTVKEIPVDLPNINNVRYREDGKLLALGYNGNIYVLSDKDKSGIENHFEVWWENKTGLRSPIGMCLTPKGYEKGQGVFVASKGKVSLIVDSESKGKADKEIIVADGWKELPHGVDALGVAIDKDNNVYFGLGCADYTNAYQVTGDKALYDLKSERGTIQKVSADFKKRETVCTGIRFSVGLAFNRHGDLFATDQEGATWLPNGNPFDELLHIDRGKHYGFPPRHPKYLPNVIDEPSVFDYGPQHQSTCGFFFNDGVFGGPQFGPKEWAGDAIVTGESRGKLFRTRLVKTPHGYVAQNHVLAALQMLTVDACLSPKGEMVIACHSGPPDWGTGPQGKGKLYKVYFDQPTLPQPLFAHPMSPREVRVHFDKPLDPEHLKDLTKKIKIEQGKYVRPGDRFETLQPPYAIVKMQLATPRYDVPVLGASVSADRRTLILATAPHTEAVQYAITLPGFGRPEKFAKDELPQHAAIDVGYDMSGVIAAWENRNGKLSVWLPHMDLKIAQALTSGAKEYKPFWKATEKGGDHTLVLKSVFNLTHMLRPAVQDGSKLDYEVPPEVIALKLVTWGVASAEMKVTSFHQFEMRGGSGTGFVRLSYESPKQHSGPLEIVSNDGNTARLDVSFSTNEDGRPRKLPIHRFSVPWATLQGQPSIGPSRDIPELRGGNWLRGKVIFHSDAAQCARCHQVGGVGGKIGPDLSNLIHRDYDSVLRDIRFPSAAINPDFLTYVVSLKDGRELIGTVRGEGEKLILGTSEGNEIAIAKGAIEAMTPTATSTMPEGLDKKLSAEELRDLMTFLLTEAPKPAPLEREGAPPPRKKAEVDAVLKGIEKPAGPHKKLHVVLAAGPKDHGPGEHDYPLWQRRWTSLLDSAPNVRVDSVMGWPHAKQWEQADVIVFYSHHSGWSEDKARDLDKFLERGGGLVYIHWAVEGHKAPALLAERIGLAWKGGESKFRHGPLEVTFDPKHPITRGLGKVRFIDESYWNLTGDPKSIEVLGTGVEEGEVKPLFWTRAKGKGRVFVSIPGHYTWTFDDPLFRLVLLRGMLWTAREHVDRWVDLASLGARMD